MDKFLIIFDFLFPHIFISRDISGYVPFHSKIFSHHLIGTSSDLPRPPDPEEELGVTNICLARLLAPPGVLAERGEGVTPAPSPLSVSL